MKKIIYILALISLVSSCNDGDIVLENLNFGNTSISYCGEANTPSNVLFKINGSQLLLIDVPANQLFNNTLSTNDNPKVYVISNDQIYYRKYSNTVNPAVICNLVPPASPVVIDQWLGQPGGVIEVVTSEVTSTNTTTGAITITGYSHIIRLKNLQLKNDQNSFVYEDYYFGEYIVKN